MFKRNKIYTVVAASALITFSAMSTAQQSETSTASVVVSNSFTLTEVAPLNLGSLGVFQNRDVDGAGPGVAGDIGQAAVYNIYSDGRAPDVVDAIPGDPNRVSRVVIVSPGTPALLDISNAVRFTDLIVTAPGGGIILEDTNLDPTLNSTFEVTIDLADMLIVGGPNDGNVVDNTRLTTGALRTDTSGAVSLSIGARVSPNPAANAILDGNYVGAFDVTIAY